MSDKQRVDEALRLLRRESDAFAETLAGLGPADWDRPTTCPPWTVRQLAAHVVRQVESYIGSVEQGMRGEPGAPESREARTRRMNEISAQEPAKIVADFRETVDQFEDWFGRLSPEQLDVTGPHSHGPRPASWFVEQRLAEVAYHRLDLDRSLGRPAELDPATARFLLPTLLGLNVPAIVRRDNTGGEGSYRLVVRGDPDAAWRLAFASGALTVTRDGEPTDASFEADAATMGLLIYGRATWPELERAGRLTVDGSRAAADRFHDLFRGP
jgi:uncharacterized protein (TIGR03083 family)